MLTGVKGLVSLVAVLVLGETAVFAADPVGRWRFEDDDKPVKVIVLGGSVSAYTLGGYAQWLSSICSDIELVNLSRSRLGAYELRQRFRQQVIKNRRLDDEIRARTWLIFLGGLNSVGSPEKTNREVAKTMRVAKEAGLSTIGVTVNPWGSERDRRWKGVDGVAYWERTQRIVDFMLGRSSPAEAFGAKAVADREDPTRFDPGELPDIAVDIWDGSLRDRDAPLRDISRLERAARRSSWLEGRLRRVEAEMRPQLRTLLLAQAAELPRWFMKEEFVGFDAIHPNSRGHREIARAICAEVPESWGCGCDRLEHLAWDRARRQPKAL